MRIRAIVFVAAAALSLGAAAASAKPVCGAWGPSTSEGKKQVTKDGVKYTCDASSKSRLCCADSTNQIGCYNEKETTYDNCTPASAQRPPTHYRPPSLGILETSPDSRPNGPSRPGMSVPTTPPSVKIN